MPRRILVLGSGFAGLWSALGAARTLDRRGIGPDEVEVVAVNRDAWHSIRVRNYEADLAGIRVPLSSVFDPVGIRHVEGEVFAIEVVEHRVGVRQSGAEAWLEYDRLVFALGSRLVLPAVPGLEAHGFDIDTFAGASRLEAHLATLPARATGNGSWTVSVLGAGLTGIEVATEMTTRLAALGAGSKGRVVLIDRAPRVGSDMGDDARPVIEAALNALGVEPRMGETVAAVDVAQVRLASGEVIPAATVVCCAGMRAHPLTGLLAVAHDRLGRLRVDETLRVGGIADVFAAGDCACVNVNGTHDSVMSCQHSRPMGRFAGHNAASDLLGEPMLPLRIGYYVTILDLGSWGAVYTQGWDRHVVSEGRPAKRTKELINRHRIYPPVAGGRQALLEAAAPVIQPPPENYGTGGKVLAHGA
ncbi:MAG: NAD(P)/FAD-dependent oxidoreductase [Acetobacteraceae bacterium]